MDETSVHHFQPETKQLLNQWKHIYSPSPKKAKIVMSSGKVMAFISLEAEEVLLVDYLDKGRTITRAYYADRLRQLRGKKQTESSWKADKRSALLP